MRRKQWQSPLLSAHDLLKGYFKVLGGMSSEELLPLLCWFIKSKVRAGSWLA